jgi:hypothetical protein
VAYQHARRSVPLDADTSACCFVCNRLSTATSDRLDAAIQHIAWCSLSAVSRTVTCGSTSGRI